MSSAAPVAPAPATSSQPQTAFPRPAWIDSLLRKYTSGVAHAFILHFNVADTPIPGMELKAYLATLKRDVVVYYNKSSGITFALSNDPSVPRNWPKETALKMMGYGQSTPSGQSSAAAAAMAAASGGATNQAVNLPKAPLQALAELEKLLRAQAYKVKEGESWKVVVDPGPEIKQSWAEKGTEFKRIQVAVIMDYAESLVPEAAYSQMSSEASTNLITIEQWGHDDDIQKSGNIVMLLTANLLDIHSSIRAAASKYEAVEIPLPDGEVRAAYINYLLATYQGTFQIRMSVAQLANATAGLSLKHIEDIFLRAKQVGSLTQQLVRERKDEIIESEFGDVLEILDPRFGFEAIGGLQHVKDYFTRSVIKPLADGNLRRIPMGVLMIGPAGTGKTAVAEALAREAGVNFVILNPARIFQGLVGASERNLEKALRAIESLEPTIVFIDEIDQAVSRGTGGDSGTSNRIFKRLLEFMSDTGHRGKVIFLAASNRPDMLDAALRRPGRFDRKIAFLIPEAEERRGILNVMAWRYGLIDKDAELTVSDVVIQNTEGWTGAELEALTVKALELTEDEGLSLTDALTEASDRLSPSTADIEFMTQLAIRETNDKDLLPPRYRDELNDRTALEAKVAELQPYAPRAGTGREL